MSLINELNKDLTNKVKSLGYDIEITLEKTKLAGVGDYQINASMMLAKKVGKNPRDIANEIVSVLDDRFTNVNIAGPGFINVTLNDQVLIDYANEVMHNFDAFVDKPSKSKKIILDYGGANVAKTLHVGHFRCNIGESVRRLCVLFGDKAISDVHWGDWGTPIGLVMCEIKHRHPELLFFDESYTGEYPEYKITNDDLGEMYPIASVKKKEDPIFAEEARILTEGFQKGVRGLRALWKIIVDVSEADCKEVYDYLGCNFDLSYGESDADPYVQPTLDLLKEKGVCEYSDGALIMHVKEETDNKEMPPLMLVKSDGGILYDTTELATMYQRVKDFDPDAMWYFTDNRQGLHFEQSFRGAYKAGIVKPEMEFKHLEFGTINGSDGRPFKTRDGGVMSLRGLIKLVYDEVEPKIKSDITGEERKDVANKLTLATLKYADLLPFRTTDYIFDVDKFTSFEGKTGIYAVYTNTRIKSLLAKFDNNVQITKVVNNDIREILIKLTEISKSLTQAYNDQSLSYICEIVYELCSLFNKFYTNCNIANEADIETKNNYIAVAKVTYNTLSNLLNILAIPEVEKM